MDGGVFSWDGGLGCSMVVLGVAGTQPTIAACAGKGEDRNARSARCLRICHLQYNLLLCVVRVGGRVLGVIGQCTFCWRWWLTSSRRVCVAAALLTAWRSQPLASQTLELNPRYKTQIHPPPAVPFAPSSAF